MNAPTVAWGHAQQISCRIWYARLSRHWYLMFGMYLNKGDRVSSSKFTTFFNNLSYNGDRVYSLVAVGCLMVTILTQEYQILKFIRCPKNRARDIIKSRATILYFATKLFADRLVLFCILLYQYGTIYKVLDENFMI